MSAVVGLEDLVDRADLERLVAGDHHDPHQILGAHLGRDEDGRDQVVIRGWRPDAVSMTLLIGGRRIDMCRLHPAGAFAVGLDSLDGLAVSTYRLEVTDRDGTTTIYDDPYACWPTLGEMDLHLFGEGRHEGLWRHLGANVRVHQGLRGTSFAVWAPSARSVRVVGDFNSWDGRVHPMRALGSSGVWEIFLPGVGPGARYKYEIVGAGGHLSLRADPMAFAAEKPGHRHRHQEHLRVGGRAVVG
jgi:1,4-alpha-glucan branching enzyme